MSNKKICLLAVCFFAFGVLSIVSWDRLSQRVSAESPESSRLSYQALSMKKPSDARYADQRSIFSSINLESAWDITTGSKSVIVAVIDDAIDIKHPDLAANIVNGYDFIEDDDDPSPNPESGLEPCASDNHGTSVAGMIGAVGNNGKGIAGVSWNVSIMPLKIGCTYNATLEFDAIKYAIDKGADIINMSYGGPLDSPYKQQITELVKKSNILLITSAGNFHGNNDDAPMYPAELDVPNILSVGASDASRNLLHWSQYGATSVDLAAPGKDILTTKYESGGYTDTNGIELLNGTSFSAPIVSGVAALLKAKGSTSVTALDLKGALMASVNPFKNTTGKLVSDGVVDAKAALDMLSTPKPVIVVKQVSWDDGVDGNGEFDSGESGKLILSLENLWAEAGSVTASIMSSNNLLSFGNNTVDFGSMGRNGVVERSFDVQLGSINAPLDVDFSVQVSADSENYTRKFAMQSGPLNSLGKFNKLTLQKNEFDEWQYFHIDYPANAVTAIIELVYELGDSRDIGLLAKKNSRPMLHFGNYLGGDYLPDDSVLSDGRSGFERIVIPIADNNPTTVYGLMFNTPKLVPSGSYGKNKPVRIRSCSFSANDNNRTPEVTISNDMLVDPDDVVVLEGSAQDNDGVIENSWWSVEGNKSLPLFDVSSTTASFIAPQSGEYTISLNASDDGCKLGKNSVKVVVRDLNDRVNGLQIFPSRFEIPEGGFVAINNIQASVNGVSIEYKDLSLEFIPEGVEISGTGRLTWANAGPIGEYSVIFGATDPLDSNNYRRGELKIVVKSRESSGSGSFGFSLGGHDGVDPRMLFLLFIIVIYRCIRRNPF